MKKKILLIISLFIFLFGINHVSADTNYCTKESAMQLAKILASEVGSDSAVNSEENFFMRITTAAVIINNANNKSGNTFYDKIYNLTDNNYAGYSRYKDSSFESVVPSDKRGELLYIAELVLTGKYTLPSNMTLQAAQYIVEDYGTIWTWVESQDGYYDVYFGYENGAIYSTDIFNNKIDNTTVTYYKNKANSLKLSDYSDYTVDTICNGLTNNITPSTPGSDPDNPAEENNTIAEACINPEILKVIYFIKLLLNIVKIAIPIGLIIMGMVDFSKSVVANDDKIQKTNLMIFLKRIMYAVLVFVIPWIVEVLMIGIGNLTEKVNFTDCLENADDDVIESIENGTFGKCYICETDNTKYYFGINPTPQNQNCNSNWKRIELSRDNCGIKKCFQCINSNKRYWGVRTPDDSSCPAGWYETVIRKNDCK
ncbi:MAG: hypothetical protein IJZ46_01980 [Bacilli bacterium]|nr:hypothetical protein [Bacilli bacterium]